MRVFVVVVCLVMFCLISFLFYPVSFIFLLCRSIKKAPKHLQISIFFSYFRGLFLCKEGV